jgi:ribose transport system substrate-binding protein
MNKGLLAVIVLVVVGAGILVVVRKEQSETPETSATTQGSTTQPSSQLTIAVIPKGTTHAYWKAVEHGSGQAGKDLGVNIIYKGPMMEDDRSGQISLVEQFVSNNVNGIVLAPLDDTALLPAVQSATAKKIPVIIIDSALKGTAGQDYVCYVGTDNRAAGKMGGKELARLMGGKGKYILLRYAVGSASTDLREKGFLDAMAENPGMTPLVTDRYAGATVDQAQTAASNMLSEIRQADGIFCPNESTTVGLLNVLEQNNLVGKVHFVGFDTTPELIQDLKKGELDALVSQNPSKMGYDGVTACVNYINGKPQAPVQDSGSALVTRDNVDTPEIQKLLAGN